MDPETKRYFAALEEEVEEAYAVAERARKRGEDPTESVEIPIAKDMADRVQNLLGIPGVAERVRELEEEMSREEAALALSADFAEGRVGDSTDAEGKIEDAVRTSVALLTEGVVAAPIEGIDAVEIRQNDDGTSYVSVEYAGPIRSAGGTAQALSVLVADYTRSLLDVGTYQPRDDEIERYVEEVALYDADTGLQYSPSGDETRHIARHCPIHLDGEPTSEREVSGFRDLERVDTNRARGGMCLVLAEGIALKAPKIQRYTRQLDPVEWPWLEDLLKEGTEDEDEGDEQAERSSASTVGGYPVPEPSERFLRDLIAGRPVFSHPSRPGGFRLRYGRARNHGFATAGVHPATMRLFDDFLAPGTQVKTERPGKAAGVVPVDTIEGPTVKLRTGEVRRIDDPAEAREIRGGVERILDVGEYLVNPGEFVENNYSLAPAGYAVEWWEQELEAAGGDVTALRDDPTIDLEQPEPSQAIAWAMTYDAPLHPAYTYLWHDIDAETVGALCEAVADGALKNGTLVIDNSTNHRDALEAILVPHVQMDDEIHIDEWQPLVWCLGYTAGDGTFEGDPTPETAATSEHGLAAVNALAPFRIRAKAPSRIGNRMGRPEKSESRELSPAVHTLFPIGDAGGDQRDVADATGHADTMEDQPGVIELDLSDRRCPDCGDRTYRARCEDCQVRTEAHWECDECGTVLDDPEPPAPACPRCERTVSPTTRHTVDIDARYHEALERVGERETAFPILKGVKGLMSAEKAPEPMEKGVLRAKHGVSAFKDGTIRYDMTDLPVTAVRPEELSVPVRQFRELGYATDIHGDPLEHDDQLIELQVQDIILSNGAGQHLLQTANFVDDLLESFYGLDPYYEVEEPEDLVGELVFGLAPHTSAAVVGRIVGFTDAAVGYAHPYFHAAKRRNCFHPETKIWYEDEKGRSRYERIEDVVENRLTETQTDDFGSVIGELEGALTVPSIDNDGVLSMQTVSAVSKHPAPSHLVRIETRSGRELIVTPDHKIPVKTDRGTTSYRASELSPSNRVILPRSLAALDDNRTRRDYDLLYEFIQSDEVPNDCLMVKGLEKERLYSLFESKVGEDWNGEFYPLKHTAEYLDVSHKTLSNYLYRESFPVSILLELLEGSVDVCAFVPDDVTLGMKRDNTEINRIIPINERVGTLLGYYAAEGFARCQETPKGRIHQTTLTGTEEVPRKFFVDTLTEDFGVDPYIENEAKITVSGRLLRVFFDSVLDAGIYANQKRIPECIFDSPDHVVAGYLRGYFSGDGTVRTQKLEVSAISVSNELVEGIIGLLRRFAINARITECNPVLLSLKFPDWYEEDDRSLSRTTYEIIISSRDAITFSIRIGFHLVRKQEVLQENVSDINPTGSKFFGIKDRDIITEKINEVEYIKSDIKHTYCLTVTETHSLIANDISVKNCDGDEDCVMLLLDGLLNFSTYYLPDRRGGRMDAPLVMSSRIDPAEIDDEAHNIDIVDQLPLSFYEATLEGAHPEDTDLHLAEETVGTDDQYRGFKHTHDVSDIAIGPDLSAYKTLESMMDKMEAQLELARKLRPVDSTDVAERVIESHFLPDLIGNLRAFSSQETRCLGCGTKYRRVPLTRACRQCGGDMTLTVHEGSVKKYMDTALRIAEQYGCEEYTIQRLQLLERSLESLFEDDTNKQSGIADFM